MTTVSRTFIVKPDPATVVNYLKDFAHAEAWDPGTEECTQESHGDIRVGTRWHNVSKIAGVTTELMYTLETLTPGRLVFKGENDSAKTTDTITVQAKAGGSEITYEAVIEPKGAGKLGEPLLKILFERIGTKTEQQMTEVLDGLVA
ncbi:SRPBCC family protein [Nocardioides sp.]|uniref:SRPBCC family protein n=1 Tax=Nocardioides sp. TaxID=35761 RepID=UPI00271C27D5|nr:SRPBCC family protein [Nocardioides sp.]MDO9456030.1 SRPBCC family protein [Nocardioides sp.]